MAAPCIDCGGKLTVDSTLTRFCGGCPDTDRAGSVTTLALVITGASEVEVAAFLLLD